MASAYNEKTASEKTASAKTASFGFEEVPWEEKAERVRGVFDQVAPRYDIMNDLMSLGLHRMWKRSMVNAIPLSANMKLLDVAGGTGDIAFRYMERLKQQGMKGSVTICDINAAMLREGRDRAIDRNLIHDVEWLCGNAEKLPLPDCRQDAYTIAFGIRNVTDIPAALAEAYRTLRPGGKFLCLEFSNVSRETLAPLYDAYSFHIIPRIGEIVAGDAAPYRYLVESIRRFPAPDRFAAMIEQAGFSRVSWRSFAGGAVALHSGWRT